MAKFCESCPIAGECSGEIEKIRTLSLISYGSVSEDKRSASFSFTRGVPQGPTSATIEYINAQGQTSDPITFRGESVSLTQSRVNEFVSKIDECNNPTTKTRFFGLITKKVCGVLQSNG